MRDWTEITNAELAELTGLTKLDLIQDAPELLEAAIGYATGRAERFVPGCPPRYRIANGRYRARALELLERVHDD